MANSLFIKADEVAELLGVSRAEAYRITKRLNDDRLIAAMLFCFALLTFFEVTQFFVIGFVYGQVSQLVSDLFEFGMAAPIHIITKGEAYNINTIINEDQQKFHIRELTKGK